MSEPSESIPQPGYPTPGPAYAQPGPAYAQPAPGYGGYPYPMMPMAPQLSKNMAITGMVLGIVGLCTALFYIGGVVGIVGLVFSIVALRKTSRGLATGKGMAIAGLVTSILAIILNAVEIVLIVWFFNTVSNCSQYDTTPDPNTGISQYNDCVRQNIVGN